MKRVFNIVLLVVLAFVLAGCDQIATENKAPVIEGETSVTYSINSKVPDWANLITATDEEDGAIRITESMIDSNVDFTTVGSYLVKFYVDDSEGKTTLFTLNVEIIDDREIIFQLKGETELTIEVNSTYIDAGATARDLDGQVAGYKTVGNVDTTTVGDYTLTYSMEGVTKPLLRTIHVVDTTAPVIAMDTVNLLYGVYSDQTWVDYITDVTDNYSESIHIEVIESTIDYNVAGSYSVTIKATDEAGNEATASFSVVLLELSFIVNGDSIIDLEVHGQYTELGATALDSDSNELTVTSESNIDVDVVGTYTVTYVVSGYDNLFITRTVNVVDTTAPVLIIEDQVIDITESDVDWNTNYDNLTDNYDNNVVVTEVEDNVLYGTLGFYTVMVLAKDSSGNESTVTFTVEVKDLDTILEELPVEVTTIEFWHIYGQGKSALLDEMIDAFELQYPNIKVESTSQGSYIDLLSKTKKAIGSGLTPDLLVGYPEHIAEYIALGEIIPIDRYIENETVGIDLDDFIPSYIEENQQFGDEMYSLPYSKSTDMLVYNKTLFSANGYEFTENQILTWEELAVMGETMVGTGANQCEFLINFDSSPNLFINSSLQWGAPYTNSDGLVLVDNDSTTSMLNYMKGLIDDNVLALPLEWDQYYGSTNFLAQDVCMTVGSTAGIIYNDPASNLDPDNQFEVGVLPIPQFEGKTQSVMQQGPNIAIMENANDAERLAAWLFMTFLTNAENTAKWAIDTGYLPVRQSGYDSVLYQEFLNNPGTDYVLESDSANAAYSQITYNNFELAFANFGYAKSSEVRDEAKNAFESIYIGNKTIEEAINDMVEKLQWNKVPIDGSATDYIVYQGTLTTETDANMKYSPLLAYVVLDGETFEMTTTDTIDVNVSGDQTLTFTYTDSNNVTYSITQTVYVDSKTVTILEFNSQTVASGEEVVVTAVIYGIVLGKGIQIYDGTGYLYVYGGGSLPSSLQLGDEVTVTGEKRNYFGLPEITNVTGIELISSNNTLPTYEVTSIVALFDEDPYDTIYNSKTIQITGMLKIEDDTAVIVATDSNNIAYDISVYYRSNETKLEELKALEGKIVTADVIVYGYHDGLKAWRVTLASNAVITSVDATDEQKAAYEAGQINLGPLDAVTDNLNLMTSGVISGTTISWASNNEAMITTAGAVNRVNGSDSTVILTATVTVGDASVTKEFTVTILAE